MSAHQINLELNLQVHYLNSYNIITDITDITAIILLKYK